MKGIEAAIVGVDDIVPVSIEAERLAMINVDEDGGLRLAEDRNCKQDESDRLHRQALPEEVLHRGFPFQTVEVKQASFRLWFVCRRERFVSGFQFPVRQPRPSA